jgi:hypothetical protein
LEESGGRGGSDSEEVEEGKKEESVIPGLKEGGKGDRKEVAVGRSLVLERNAGVGHLGRG